MSTTTKAKHYKVTRRKVVHGQTIPMVFSWTEGDGYIGIQFPGCYEHDVIQAWDYEANVPLFTGREAFIAEVAEYLKDTEPDTLTEYWTSRSREGS
ncbi:MAG TPA: hypothetical protein DEP82_14860 [Arthrobacter bacterium]|jgi:hypothetical protein|nr:hypothetical protein [Arthrobacter sp.]